MSIPICAVTGLIAGDSDACGDCDPCGADHTVPDAVKRLLAEKDEWRGKYSDAMSERDSRTEHPMSDMEKAIEAAAKALMDDLYDGRASLPEDHPAYLPVTVLCTKRAELALTAALPHLVQEWQDISTAPKDGTPLLAWENEARGPFKCWWNADWSKAEAYWTDDADSEPQPTHWRPLPDPPAAHIADKRESTKGDDR